MKTKTVYTLAMIALFSITFFTSCSKDEGCTDPVALNFDPEAEDDDGSCVYLTEPNPIDSIDSIAIKLNFTHNFDGTPVTGADFGLVDYVNANNDTLTITRLRYLISNVRFYTADGDSILIPGYRLVDVGTGMNLTYELLPVVPKGTYTGISFSFGLDSVENEGNYPDLNIVNWSYPTFLGDGGYHYMQMEGRYKEQGADSLYAYHYVLKRLSPGVFENNNFKADLAGVTLNKLNAEIEVRMDIAEWYKTPNTWDLNVFHALLMPNPTAQEMMQQNGMSVFSLGTVNQFD